MWQTECIVCTVNIDVANKIIIKMPHQPLILKKEKKLIYQFLQNKKDKKLKSKKYMNLDLSSSLTRTLKNTNLDLNIRTCA